MRLIDADRLAAVIRGLRDRAMKDEGSLSYKAGYSDAIQEVLGRIDAAPTVERTENE